MEVAGAMHGEEAIDIAHRKAAGGFIVRFHSRSVRDEVYDRRFQLQGKSSLDLGKDFTVKNDLYINESLTFDRSVLMKQVRDRLKEYNKDLPKDDRRKCKTALGIIKVTDETKTYQKIFTMKNLDDIL